MGQMRCHAVTVVGHEGATRATLLPSRAEHEVLHQQLPAALEQVGKAAPALGCVENVILVDAHPRQRAALAGAPVTQVRQFFFLRQQRLALGKPFVPGDYARAFTEIGRAPVRESGCQYVYTSGSAVSFKKKKKS